MADKNKKFSIYDRLRSFKFAFNGLKILLRDEHNARIHIGIAIVVCVMGFVFEISASEWLAVIILIGMVIGMEIVNSCIEKLCDFVSPSWHDNIKQIKDLASAAVLIMAAISVVGGLIIFLPKIIDWIKL